MAKANFIARLRISYQLLIVFLAIQIPATAGLVWLAYYNINDALTEELNNKLQAISDRQIRQINDYVKGQINNTTTLAQMPDIVNYLSDSLNFRKSNEIIQQNIAVYRNNFKVKHIVLVSTAQKILCSTDNNLPLGADISKLQNGKTELAKACKRASTILQTDFSDFTFAQGNTAPTAFVASPVRSRQGRFLGLVIAEIDNQVIDEQVNDYTGLGKTGETRIAAKIDGQILLTTNTRKAKLSNQPIKKRTNE